MIRSRKFSLPLFARSLSARLLVLTIVFVMLAEVFIYAPSVSNFRTNWLKDEAESAHLAILARLRTYARPELTQALRNAIEIDGYDYDWSLNDTAEH